MFHACDLSVVHDNQGAWINLSLCEKRPRGGFKVELRIHNEVLLSVYKFISCTFSSKLAPKFIGKLMFVRGERMCVWVGEGVEESALEACIRAINTL